MVRTLFNERTQGAVMPDLEEICSSWFKTSGNILESHMTAVSNRIVGTITTGTGHADSTKMK